MVSGQIRTSADMDISEVIKTRNSTRGFKPIKITGIEEIAEKAKIAPSAGGLRAYSFELVTDGDKIKELAYIAHQNWIATASLIVVVKDEPERSMSRYGERGRIYAIQDATLFLSYFDLLCVDKGLGTCWVGAFNTNKLNALTMLVVGGI